MSPFSLFNKREELLAIDIGSGAIKMVEIVGSIAQPTLLSFAVQELDTDIFSNNSISKPEFVADLISKQIEANEIEAKRVAINLPAPAVFTKRIKMPKQGEEELRSAVQYEAANFIPHKIDAVKLDFAVLGEAAKNQLDILVVAIKTELLESLEDCLALAGLECAVADVDFFALHNVFQRNYGGSGDVAAPGTSAVLSIGYRYSSLAISREGLPLFVGDVAIGLKQLEEELALKLNMAEPQCRSAVKTMTFSPECQPAISGYIDQSSTELSRQLSFFWNTCGVEGKIDKLYIAGGGALLPGFIENIGLKTGIESSILNPFLNIAVAERVDKKYLEKVSPLLAVAVGLGLRVPGDGQKI